MKMGSLAFLLFTSQAMTSLAAPTREKVICKNEHYLLVLRETAVPTYKVATLSFSDRNISLKCQGEFQEKNVSFSCEEDRAGEGRYLAGVVLIGETGSAEIAHEQAYPLRPQPLATLPCQVTQE